MSFGYGSGPSGPSSTPQSTWGTMRQGVLDYLQDVVSGKIASQGVLSQQRAPYDLNKSLRENLPEISPEAIDIAMGIGPGAIRAFHGSPHSFSRFDSSKIGTGEGAQAYGHGLYFAEAEPVAESYLRTADWRYGGRKAQTIYDRLNDQANERGLDNAGWDRLNAQRGFWEKVALGQSPRNIISDAVTNPSQYGPAELAYIQSLDPTKFKRAGGHMYEVDINADPARLLDWDKPLSAQSQTIKDLATTHGVPVEIAPYAGRGPGQVFGHQLYDQLINRLSPTGLSRLNAPPRVSQQLNEAGIPGIRYLDQFSRGATGPGTSNYVVFDPKRIEILRKYGLLGPLAAGGALLPGEDGGQF